MLVNNWRQKNRKVPAHIDEDIVRNFELMRWIGDNAMKRPGGRKQKNDLPQQPAYPQQQQPGYDPMAMT